MTVHGVGSDLGHDRRNLLDDPGVLANRGSHLAVTVGAVRERILDVLIDVGGPRSMRPRMAGLAARCSGAPPRARLQVHRLHPRGRSGTDRRSRTLGLKLVPAFGLLGQGEDGVHRLLARQLHKSERLRPVHAIRSAVSGARQ